MNLSKIYFKYQDQDNNIEFVCDTTSQVLDYLANKCNAEEVKIDIEWIGSAFEYSIAIKFKGDTATYFGEIRYIETL